jgi:hypothetical protein
MAWIELKFVPLLASGIAMLLLAVLLAAIDFRKRVNRAFATVMALRGLTLLLSAMALPASVHLAMQRFLPYLSLAIFPLLLLFASHFPRRRGPLGRKGAGWFAIGAIAVLWAVYFVWHEGYYTIRPGTTDVPILDAGKGLVYEGFGPLAVLGYGIFPVMAALGWLFARDYTRSEPGTQRTSYFLVACGFLVNGVFDGTRQTVGLVRLMMDSEGFAWAPWGWTIAVLPALSLLLALAGLVNVGLHSFRGRAADQRQERRRESLLFALAGLAALTGAAPTMLPAGSEFFVSPPMLIVLGLWRLTLPLFVTYALMRYALFDIDLKVRAAVAWTFVVVVFGAVYFLVSETLEGLVSDRFGQFGGLAAAGLLTVAGDPLAKAGRKVAKALMPGVRELKSVAPSAGEEIYRQQFLMLQEDGTLTEKERRSLEDLRGRLGLTPSRTKRIELTALARVAGGSSGSGQPA